MSALLGFRAPYVLQTALIEAVQEVDQSGEQQTDRGVRKALPMMVA